MDAECLCAFAAARRRERNRTTRNPTVLRAILIALIVCVAAGAGFAQGSATNSFYQLLEGSYLIDDCSLCGRPTIFRPMRGSFDLVLTDRNPIVARYQLQNISFTAGTNKITGSGTFQIGGEVALLQDMVLNVQVNGQPFVFTNESKIVSRRFPLIQISLIQTQAAFIFYRMDLVAAPFREIWFSTVANFTSANGFSGSAGDLLSASGRIVKPNSDLIAGLGFMPAVGPAPIDAVDIGPGGEILFSLNDSRFSETLGQIQHGDLVSNRGRIVSRNQTLLAAFQPQPASTDYGLDAVHVNADGEVLFSTRSNVVSGTLKTTLQVGDILSSRGQIIRRNADLLARFHPSASSDYGLDALYVWPHGGIWFSTEEGFQSQAFGAIQAGDLVSAQGLIVYRTQVWLPAFAPVEDPSDFGLDALFIVTDVTPAAPPPNFTRITANQASGTISLQWDGPGGVFQVEKAEVVTGPFLPFSPIQPDLSFDDPKALAGKVTSFYRLRQW